MWFCHVTSADSPCKNEQQKAKWSPRRECPHHRRKVNPWLDSYSSWLDFGATLGRLCDDFGTILGRLWEPHLHHHRLNHLAPSCPIFAQALSPGNLLLLAASPLNLNRTPYLSVDKCGSCVPEIMFCCVSIADRLADASSLQEADSSCEICCFSPQFNRKLQNSPRLRC